MKLQLSIFIWDVLVAGFMLCLDVHLVYAFVCDKQYGYALATLGIMLLPGALGKKKDSFYTDVKLIWL